MPQNKLSFPTKHFISITAYLINKKVQIFFSKNILILKKARIQQQTTLCLLNLIQGE